MSIRKIAAATGLSVASVSRALRDDQKVGAATRKRVLVAARQLGYSPNPYVGNMMSALRRGQTSTFRGNIAIVWKKAHSLRVEDRRFQQTLDGVRVRARERGYCLDEFDLSTNKPDALQRILFNRGIQGVIAFTPAFAGTKVRLQMMLEKFACVSLGWGLWVPHLDAVRVDYFQMLRLALHHAGHIFRGAIAAIWDLRTDRSAHNAGRASFVLHHPSGPAVANELFLSWNELTERALAKVVRKHVIRCLLLNSSVVPPAWLEKYVPAKNWVWFRDPGAVPHIGRIDPQNHLVGQWGVDLLATKIQMGEIGIPQHCKKILVPPVWIPGK